MPLPLKEADKLGKKGKGKAPAKKAPPFGGKKAAPKGKK